MQRPLPVQLILAAFRRWESLTDHPLESALGSPRVTRVAGEWLSLIARAGALQQRWLRTWWSTWGMASREDQERAQHALNELQSRLYDLEDMLQERNEGH